MDKKARILGIAPYEGMELSMKNLAAQRNDMILDVYVGDMEKGMELVNQHYHNNYDAVISRGGTAELIHRNTSIPVIEISLSVYDILRAIKLAENYANRYAIVGFSAITDTARLLCDLLQYQLDIFTIHSEAEVLSTLTRLKAEGYSMVLCDMIGNTIARKIGLNAILITSGEESISAAFDQAVKLCSSFMYLKQENSFLTNLLKQNQKNTAVLNTKNQIIFSTFDTDEQDYFHKIIVTEADQVPSAQELRLVKTKNHKQYTFIGRRTFSDYGEFILFVVSESPSSLSDNKYGIRYSNRREIEEHFFNSFYSVTNSSVDIENTIKRINTTDSPVMILGETGTGKEHIAGVLYAGSSFANSPMITINCAIMSEKGWNFITSHDNSPLNSNNNTIYFQNLDSLSEEKQKYLLSIIADTNLCKRNRVIFSCLCDSDLNCAPITTLFISYLSCMTLHLPPLRQRTDDFPTLISLYLNNLNVKLPKQTIGVEQDAMELLKQYSWPHNYTQFKRILSELCVLTTTPYISADAVKQQLSKESGFHPASPAHIGSSEINLHQPLDKITQEIIQLILNENNGNQTLTAKQLGISRSTLWRYLAKT